MPIRSFPHGPGQGSEMSWARPALRTNGRRTQSSPRPAREPSPWGGLVAPGVSTPARSSAADHTRAASSNVHLASRPRPGPATPTLLRSGLAWPRSDAACLACLVSDGTSFQTLLFSFGNRRPVHAAPNSPSLSTAIQQGQGEEGRSHTHP